MNGVPLPIQSISFGVTGTPLLLCWVLLALALGLSVWAYRAPEPPLRRVIRVVLGGLRFVALAILILILFQPVVTLVGGGSERPPLPVLVDLSRSMNLPAAAGDSLTRLQQIVGVIETALPDLEQRFDVRLFGFGDRVQELAGASGSGQAWRATAGATRLGPALSEVLGLDLVQPAPLCLVLTDGAVNAGTDPVGVAERFGVPLFIVPAAGDSLVEDLWIAECLVNRSAFLGQETTLAVRVGSFLPTSARVRVILKQGERLLSGEQITLPAGAGDTELRLNLVPDRLGTQHFRVEVEAVPGEVSTDNNHRAVVVEVLEERLQVLLLADEVSWDLTFTRRALDSDRTLETTVLARLERDGQVFRPIGDGKIRQLPARAQELLPFGAVVLVGVQPGRLPAPTRTALRAYVNEGGGLIVLAGQHGQRLRQLVSESLSGQLPIRVLGAAAPGLVAPELTAAGLAHPVTSLGESPARAVALWGDLPPVHATADIEAALGGDVLIEGEVDGRRRALVVAGPAGSGRALVIAAADIWRWDLLLKGRGRDDTVFRRLLSEAVRWTAEGRRHGNLELFADQSVFLGGERVTVGARLTDDRLQAIDDATIQLELLPESGGQALTVPMLPGETHGHYAGDAGFLAAGIYRMRGLATRGERSWPAEGGHFMVDSADLEGVMPVANLDLLRRLASRSGGEMVPPAAAGRLAAIVEARRERLAAVEIKLWNHYLMFGLFVAALTLEWLLRRRHGLA